MSESQSIDPRAQVLDGTAAAKGPQPKAVDTPRGPAIFLAERRQRLLLAAQALPARSVRNILVWALACASSAGLVLGAVWLERYRGTPGLAAKQKARVAEERQHLLADVLAAQAQLKKEGVVIRVPKGSAEQRQAGRTGHQENQKTSTIAPKTQAAHPSVPKGPPKNAAEQQSDAYFASYGDYHGGNGWRIPQVKSDKAKQSRARHGGRLLRARLTGEVSSTPGDVAIAKLTETVVLGNVTLPKDTQIHGTSYGASPEGDLLYIKFQFLRLATGETYDIQGTALGLSGRSGIPGKRRITARTVGSVGLASVGEMAGAVGQTIAGATGHIIGKGVEGGVQSGSQKAQRIDRDESVVTVPKGMEFNVYLISAELS